MFTRAIRVAGLFIVIMKGAGLTALVTEILYLSKHSIGNGTANFSCANMAHHLCVSTNTGKKILPHYPFLHLASLMRLAARAKLVPIMYGGYFCDVNIHSSETGASPTNSLTKVTE